MKVFVGDATDDTMQDSSEHNGCIVYVSLTMMWRRFDVQKLCIGSGLQWCVCEVCSIYSDVFLNEF